MPWFAGLLLLTEYACVPFTTGEQFWWIIFGAAACGLPLTLRQAWEWKASTCRFENWNLLDLGEQPSI